jgi:hypothetical protein
VTEDRRPKNRKRPGPNRERRRRHERGPVGAMSDRTTHHADHAIATAFAEQHGVEDEFGRCTLAHGELLTLVEVPLR